MEIKLEKEIFSTSDLRITRYLFGKWWFLTFISYYIQVLTQSDYVYVLVAQLCPTMGFPMLAPGSDPTDSRPPGSSIHGDSPGKNTGVGCHFLFQVIFPTQGSNPCLLCSRVAGGAIGKPLKVIIDWIIKNKSYKTSGRKQEKIFTTLGLADF